MPQINQEIWATAAVIHDTKQKLCYGSNRENWRMPFPPYGESNAYLHNPHPDIDIALAQAKAVLAHV